MNKKDKKDSDDFLKGFNEEFRSVRFYSNFNGVEKEYGYDYNRDKEGKEEYREIGEIPDEYGNEIFDRINNLQKSFNWNQDTFSRSLKRFADIFPGLRQLLGEVSQPELITGDHKVTENKSEKQDYQTAYDLQVDEGKRELYLIVELPGFSKEDVKLKLVKQKLLLSAENNKKRVDSEIPIPHKIDSDEKIVASMKHGILEVKLKLLENQNENDTDIPIN